ncbi:hypothetical protein [Comamonas testosteroni]|uniref:hypothetical protein n=1 Tax=Comamonas testosteroni TaxID=285 RepID=UPI0015FB3CAB|nr:hypothetical protein [Comamonas testosteroni]
MNQAPDSIPGMFKPGEFVLPPDTVHAMGGKQALQGVVDATHTPVPSGFGLRRPAEPAAKPGPGLGLHRSMLRSADPVEAPQLGLRPQVFFANGGAPEDQIQQSGVAAKPSAAPSPSNTFPGSRLPGNSGSTSAPTTPAAAPVAAATQQTEQGGFSYQDNNRAVGADIKRTWNEGNYGEAIGKTVAGTVGAVTTPIIDGAVNAGGAVAGFGRGLFGIGDDAPTPNAAPVAAAPAAGTAVARGGAAPAAPIAAGAAPGAGAGQVNQQTAAPAPGNQVVNGVYNHGRGQYSDQSTGMGFPAGFTGKPSAQNNAAAGALAQSEAGGFGLKRPAQPEPGGFGLHAPTVSHSGNDWAARQRLKDMETSASSITNRAEWRSGSSTPAWGSRHQGQNDPDGKIARFNAATQADLVAQGRAPELQQRTNEINAGLRRTAMAEAGADRRAQGQIGLGLRRLDLDQQRNQLDAQRVASDERLRAPQIRAAERLGQLQEAYVNAKTPEEQAAIASQMRAYSGKDEADWKVQVTPATKNLDGSTTAGSVIRYNSRTGDVQEVGGVGGKPQVPAKDSLKAGQVYQTPRGQARWNGTEFELVG